MSEKKKKTKAKKYKLPLTEKNIIKIATIKNVTEAEIREQAKELYDARFKFLKKKHPDWELEKLMKKSNAHVKTKYKKLVSIGDQPYIGVFHHFTKPKNMYTSQFRAARDLFVKSPARAISTGWTDRDGNPLKRKGRQKGQKIGGKYDKEIKEVVGGGVWTYDIIGVFSPEAEATPMITKVSLTGSMANPYHQEKVKIKGKTKKISRFFSPYKLLFGKTVRILARPTPKTGLTNVSKIAKEWRHLSTGANFKVVEVDAEIPSNNDLIQSHYNKFFTLPKNLTEYHDKQYKKDVKTGRMRKKKAYYDSFVILEASVFSISDRESAKGNTSVTLDHESLAFDDENVETIDTFFPTKFLAINFGEEAMVRVYGQSVRFAERDEQNNFTGELTPVKIMVGGWEVLEDDSEVGEEVVYDEEIDEKEIEGDLEDEDFEDEIDLEDEDLEEEEDEDEETEEDEEETEEEEDEDEDEDEDEEEEE